MIFEIVDLVKAVDACVRSAFGNVSFFVSLSSCSICSLPLLCSPNVRLILLVSSCSSSLLRTKYFTLPMLSSAFFSAPLWTKHLINSSINQPTYQAAFESARPTIQPKFGKLECRKGIIDMSEKPSARNLLRPRPSFKV